MKKFIIITIIIFIILSGAMVYLNKVILPKKIKSLIVLTLKKQTGKDVTLKSLEFSLFKGLILYDLVVTDNKNVILSTPQATCSIFIWPIFKKQIIIPSINLKSPYIFLERRVDNSFNLQDLFILSKPEVKKSDFNVSVFKINISGGDVVFQDDTLSSKFKKEIKNIQLNLHLGLPASVKFLLKGEIQNNLPVFIVVSGEYKILSQELFSNIAIKNLSLQEFAPYYNDLGNLVSGLIDLEGQIRLEKQLFMANITTRSDNFNLLKEKLKAKLSFVLQTKVDYNLETKKLEFSGACDILQADISGIGLLPDINNLRGKFDFNQRSLIADSLKAELLGKSFEIKLGIKDFNTPVVSIDTDLDLSFLPSILKDKFNFSNVNSAGGKAFLSIKAHPSESGVWVLQGNMDIKEASLKLDKQNILLDNIFAKLGFSQNGLGWENTKFKYQGIEYQSSGTLTNFNSPNIKLKLYSLDLSLVGDLDLLDKKIKLNQVKGKYLDSQFLINGTIDQADLSKGQLDLSGKVNLELDNLNKILNKQYPILKDMRLLGQMDVQFNLIGNPVDFKNCYFATRLASNNFSFYGLNTQSFSLNFFQDQRIAKITNLRMDFYDGLIQGSGALDLNTPNSPYQFELKVSDINLQKLKNDTPSKNKNIAGILFGELKANSFLGDLSKLDGAGSFTIKDGKLWELNLLQGLGKLLFAKDLGSIELSECFCEFLIKDKSVYTDKLQLKGNIANLTGPLRIGFDGSLVGSLDVDILSELVPMTGTLKDLSTAFIGQAGKFGVIKLSGTLKDPKYNFKLATTNIIQGITDVLFGKSEK